MTRSEGVSNPPQLSPPQPCTHLLILVPGQRLGGQHKPVLLGAALHEADVVDGQPAPADHLRGTGCSEDNARRPARPTPAQRPLPLSPGWKRDHGRDTSSLKPSDPTPPCP